MILLCPGLCDPGGWRRDLHRGDRGRSSPTPVYPLIKVSILVCIVVKTPSAGLFVFVEWAPQEGAVGYHQNDTTLTSSNQFRYPSPVLTPGSLYLDQNAPVLANSSEGNLFAVVNLAANNSPRKLSFRSALWVRSWAGAGHVRQRGQFFYLQSCGGRVDV